MNATDRLGNAPIPAESEAILQEIEAGFGMRPHLFLAYARHPALLRTNFEKVKVLMMGGLLSRKVKEAIALTTSKAASCAYCVGAHTAALKSIGVSDDEIERVEGDLERADFTPEERALIRLAQKASAAPLTVEEADVQAARDAGAGAAAIVEALGVMELFAGFNRFADALGVELDR